jgi:hypothetical protein
LKRKHQSHHPISLEQEILQTLPSSFANSSTHSSSHRSSHAEDNKITYVDLYNSYD